MRVLDLSRLLPGPFCTLVLGDLGAQVDKLEDPYGGDYLRLFPPLLHGLSGRFAAINRDKRSLCLDLKNPAGRQAFLQILPRYDVVVESFRPGVLARLGLAYEALAERHPKLVLCSISGYGQDGPYRERAGHDLNYCALAGVLDGCAGGPEQAPHPLPIQLADIAGGGLWAATGILAALFSAQRDGKGQHLDISMCEGALSFLLPDLGNYAASGAVPERGTDLLTGGTACYGVYRTADRRFLSVAALEPKFWLAFNGALGRKADAAELAAPLAEQRRIRGEIQAILESRTLAEWLAVFAGVDACVEPVLTLAEARQHPLHAARQVFFSAGAEGEAMPQTRTPLRPRDAGAAGLPPRSGQHSEEILKEGGLDDTAIAALRQAGAVR